MSEQDVDATTTDKWHATKTNMSMAVGSFSIISLAAHTPGGIFFGGLTAWVLARHGDEIANGVRSLIPQELVDEVMRRLNRKKISPKDAKEEICPPPAQANEWSEDWYEDEEDTSSPVPGESFTLSDLLAAGFQPTLNKIFLARLVDGSPVYVAAKDLCHVALAGVTGGGKSSLMRLIMAQLCKVGVPVLLLNPHYMRFDYEGGEDWTPYEPYLKHSPVVCAKYATIKYYLQWMVETLLPRRIERCAKGGKVGNPYFIVIDELPAITAEIKEASGYIAKILREGRKYGIFMIVAAQDFLAKTVSAEEGGAIRKCYRTAFYVGGDSTTAKVLLNMPPSKIPENQLGKGTIMLRCSATKEAVLAYVPYVDNDSLYRMLGPSTFRAAIQEEDEDIAPSKSPSQANGVSPSNTPSSTRSTAYTAEGACEADGRRNEGAGVVEGEQEALTELEKQIGEMFFAKDMNPNSIVSELWPDVKGGTAYQQKAIIVASAIRKVGLR